MLVFMLLNSKAPDAKMAEGAFSININKIKIFARILVIKGGFFKIKGKNKNLKGYPQLLPLTTIILVLK